MRKWLSLIFVSIVSLFVFVQVLVFNAAKCAVVNCKPAIQFMLRPELATVFDPLADRWRTKKGR